MEIDRNFSLNGFIRKDYGEYGCVFLKYATPKDEKREPTIRESYYGGYYDVVNYTLQIPKPKKEEIAGIVMIFRMSKNRYQVSISNGKRVQIEQAASLSAIRELCGKLFKN